MRIAADSDRLAAQLRPVALLDGRVERVHVDVKDPADAVGVCHDAGLGAVAKIRSLPKRESSPFDGGGTTGVRLKAGYRLYTYVSDHLRLSFVTPGIGTGGTASGPNATCGGVRSCPPSGPRPT